MDGSKTKSILAFQKEAPQSDPLGAERALDALFGPEGVTIVCSIRTFKKHGGHVSTRRIVYEAWAKTMDPEFQQIKVQKQIF